MKARIHLQVERVSDRELVAFYRASMVGLRFIEHQRPSGRRFGSDADARWKALRGDLATIDRIDLMIRDASAQWPGSFGARLAFAKDNVAEDDPFGACWVSLDTLDGEEVWRWAAQPTPTTAGEALTTCATVWGLEVTRLVLPPIEPGHSLLVLTPSAIVAVGAFFAEAGADFDFADQVLVEATHPGERQIAGIASALANTTKPLRVVKEATAEDRRQRRQIRYESAGSPDR